MRFRDFKLEKEKWIAFVESDFYPDYLNASKTTYTPVLERFNELLQTAHSSQELFLLITKESGKQRIQLLRIFRKYISPDTSVEMLKIKTRANKILQEFGSRFRPIEEVRKRFDSRVKPDEALMAILHEYENRGRKGYEVSGRFFEWFKRKYGTRFSIEGPERAGKGIYLEEVFKDYPKSRSVDFLIRYQKTPIVIGFVRYDSDRGGAQENDRTGGYGNSIIEILNYSGKENLGLKILFVNEGPGLLLGSMWDDYATLEDMGRGCVMVVTLKMLESRLTEQWMLGK